MMRQNARVTKQKSQENLIQILRTFDIEQYNNNLDSNAQLLEPQIIILKEFIIQHYQSMERYQKQAREEARLEVNAATEEIQHLFLRIRQFEIKLSKYEKEGQEKDKTINKCNQTIDNLERQFHKKQIQIKGLLIQQQKKNKYITILEAAIQQKDKQLKGGLIERNKERQIYAMNQKIADEQLKKLTTEVKYWKQQYQKNSKQRDFQLNKMKENLQIKDKHVKQLMLLAEVAKQGLINTQQLNDRALMKSAAQSSGQIFKLQQIISETIQLYELSIACILGEKLKASDQLSAEMQEVIKAGQTERQARKRLNDSIQIIFSILNPKVTSIFEWKKLNFEKIKGMMSKIQSRASLIQNRITNMFFSIKTSPEEFKRYRNDYDEHMNELKKICSTNFDEELISLQPSIDGLNQAWSESNQIKKSIDGENSRLGEYSFEQSRMVEGIMIGVAQL